MNNLYNDFETVNQLEIILYIIFEVIIINT